MGARSASLIQACPLHIFLFDVVFDAMDEAGAFMVFASPSLDLGLTAKFFPSSLLSILSAILIE